MTDENLSSQENGSGTGDLLGVEEKVLAFIRQGEGYFEDLLLKSHALQRTRCPEYAAFCAAQTAPAVSWREIPAIPLSAFRHSAIRCFPASETQRTFHTSGTTGEGFGCHHFRNLTIYQAAARQGWRRAGLPEKNIFCLLPTPDQAPHSSLSQMAAWLAPADHFFHGNWSALREQLVSLGGPEGSGPPLTLFGTALAFLDFFQWLGERRLSLPAGSQAVETGGYKGTRQILSKAELQARFQARLGLAPDALWNEYGMTELSSQFYSRGSSSPHQGPPWVRALVIDPETGRECGEGETGVLRIFDLANTGSCCAIQTRDLAIRRGANFELLGRDPSALPRGCSRRAEEMLGE